MFGVCHDGGLTLSTTTEHPLHIRERSILRKYWACCPCTVSMQHLLLGWRCWWDSEGDKRDSSRQHWQYWHSWYWHWTNPQDVSTYSIMLQYWVVPSCSMMPRCENKSFQLRIRDNYGKQASLIISAVSLLCWSYLFTISTYLCSRNGLLVRYTHQRYHNFYPIIVGCGCNGMSGV